jgi:hypothetical protein
VELLCTRVGVLDRGKLVLQQDLADLQRPTGRIIVETPDPGRAVALLDGRVEDRAGASLVIRHDDPAALNALLVGQGIRVTAMTAQRRSLEEVVLAITGTGSDQVGDLPAADTPSADSAGGTDDAPAADASLGDAPASPADGSVGSAGGGQLNGNQSNGSPANGSPANGKPANGNPRQAGRQVGRDTDGAEK